ncbi:MAG: S8 family serine peptidase [Planctomycetes bacterium]|nr:S8 family serine peptidase [Planctomycetota bacterium]
MRKTALLPLVLSALFPVGSAALAAPQDSAPIVHPVPGSSAWSATWRGRDERGVERSFATWTPDGVRVAPPQVIEQELCLRYARFDPLAGVPPVPGELDGSRGRLFIVQFQTPAMEPYRASLRAQGVKLAFYLAYNAQVVEGDAAQVASLAKLPFVRWVGPFHPAYKLEEGLLDQAAGAELLRVNLLSTYRGPEGLREVHELVRGLGGEVSSPLDPSFLTVASVRADRLVELARSSAVQWIDRWSAPEEDMDIARNFHGANYVESVAGYNGSGVRVEVMDGGCDTTHPDLQNFVVHTTTVAGAHGTCTSGIVVGSGAGNAAARGVLPNAFLTIGYYNNFAGGSRYNHTAELQNPSLAYKAVLQSNSWGSSLTTAYNSTSQNLDLILFDQQRISILQSQSNAGTQSSRPEAWAKNIISVGGIKHANTETKSDDNWTNGASIGPAADGRIKPDIASFYDATLCTDVVGSGGYVSGNYYSSFGGTSGATPITAGHTGLLYQMWADGVFGNAAPAATVFEDRPHNTTMKALLINTATQWSFTGTTSDLTRTHQGWGHADVRNAWNLRGSMYLVDESDVLAELASTTHAVNVTAGTPALKATLVFRDYPGTTSSTVHRVNNLDLRVTSPSGAIYHGNVGLNAGVWSTTGGAPNTLDTVENVFVPNPAAGTWQITITAAELNQDAHVETGAIDSDYALVVSGVSAAPTTPPAAPTSLGATAISSSRIDLAWTDNASDEAGFKIERSLDGSSWAEIAQVGANATSFASSGLSASTTYYYQVRAFNGGGDSAYSNTANATTSAITFTVHRASAETTVAGGRSGTFASTIGSDNVYESLTEVLSAGSSSRRYSYLEHRWTVNVAGGTNPVFFVEAHRTANSEGDNFVFAYSTDGVNFTTMLTVTKTADDNTAQSFALPTGLTGTVTIRVQDADRTRRRTVLDTLYVDDLYLRTQS